MTTLTLRCALRARPDPCQCAGGERGMRLLVIDTTGLIPGSFIAVWRGDEAPAFVDQHRADLIPGRCVDLQLIRVRAVADGLRADVLQCSLAPLAPSWTGKQPTTRADGVYSSDFRQ